jgi:hypothetical protein
MGWMVDNWDSCNIASSKHTHYVWSEHQRGLVETQKSNNEVEIET